jgi:hypothetical protein
MLRTRSIPIHDDDPDDWHTFLYKAAKGSIKAPDTLTYANMAYMVALTGDSTCPDTMHLDDYNAIVRERFPAECPVASLQHFHDIALDAGWITTPFRILESPRNSPSEYIALWGRRPVAESALLNDAMLHCLERWSADHFIECVDHYGAEYDSRAVTTGMLYLSLTWPGT